jgi:hypothetical protein
VDHSLNAFQFAGVSTEWVSDVGFWEDIEAPDMKSQYRRALPFQPQCATVGMYPKILLIVFVADWVKLK